MSDASISEARPHARLRWRPALAFAVLGAGATGLTIQGGSSDAELAVLLRFMAVIKAAMALGAAALVGWRLAWPVRNAIGFGYIAATAATAFGSGLIWQLGHVGAGAALVHGGLAALAGLAWIDRAAWEVAARTIAVGRRQPGR